MTEFERHDDDALDALVSALAVEAGADGDDWRAFAAQAADDPALWDRLAGARRDQQALERLVGAAGRAADRVELPRPALRAGAAPQPTRTAPPLWPSLRQWGGWAIAAALLLVVILRPGPAPARLDAPDGPALTTASAEPTYDEALRRSLDVGRASGTVVGEVPTRVMLETRPAPDGDGYEVLYLRQILERTRVPDLYRVEGGDETGRPTLVRYDGDPADSM